MSFTHTNHFRTIAGRSIGVVVLLVLMLGLAFSGLVPVLQYEAGRLGVVSDIAVAQAASVGPSTGTCSQVDYAGGTVSWTSPDKANGNDTVYGTVSVDGPTSEYIYCSGFGFAIPENAMVDGVSVAIEVFSNSAADGGSSDSSVRLATSSSVLLGDDKQTGAAFGTAANVNVTYGASSDDWNAGLTAADVNGSGFGVMFAVKKTGPPGAAHTVSVDVMTITLTYTVPVVSNPTLLEGTLFDTNGSTPLTSRVVTAVVGTDRQSTHSTTTDGSGNFSIDLAAPGGVGAFASSSIAGNNDAWRGVTYGEGLYVAVAECRSGGPSDDCIATSPDGVTWTARTLTPSEEGFPPALSDVTYGEGRFVAVGRTWTSDTAWYSDDGINWSLATSGGYGDWNEVTYANGRFVVVGDSGGIMYSDDGASWTAVTALGNDDPWNAVAYGNGRWVAVAWCEFSGDCVMYSDDNGATWATTTIAGNNDGWRDIVYANGRFVAIASGGSGGADTAYSTDGITWTTSSESITAWVLESVNDQLIAFTVSGDIQISTDGGNTWTAQEVLGKNDSWTDSVYADGRLVIVSEGGDRAAVAPVALAIEILGSFATTTSIGNGSFYDVTYANGMFMAVGGFASDIIMYSYDGIDWVGVDGVAGDNDRWESIAYGNGRWVAVGDCSDGIKDCVVYSTDGINWSVGTPIGGGNDLWSSVTYGNGRFVAVACGLNTFCDTGVTGERVMYSVDGATWTAVSGFDNNIQWSDVTYGNGRFVAVVDGDQDFAYSDDGMTWATTTGPGAFGNWGSVTYGNGVYVAVAYTNGMIATSTDGINWPTSTVGLDYRPLGGNETWSGVTYGNGQFIVSGAGGDNRLAISPDAINWTPVSVAGDNDTWNGGVAYGNGRLVLVNDGWQTDPIAYADMNFGPETPITLFVDSETEKASALTFGFASSSNVDLQAGATRIAGVENQVVDLTQGTFFDSVDNSDVNFTIGTNEAVFAGGLLVGATSTVAMPQHVQLGGDYHNDGVVNYPVHTTLVFENATADVSGNLVGSSALPAMIASGTSAVTFTTNASTTSLVINSGASVTAPSVLTVQGSYTNNGSFDANNGTVHFGGLMAYNLPAYTLLNSSSSLANGSAGIAFSDDGMKLYLDCFDVCEYELSSEYDITTASAPAATLSPDSSITMQDFRFADSGRKLYINGWQNDTVDEFTLAVPWDLATAVFTASTSLSGDNAFPAPMFVKEDGTGIYAFAGGTFRHYELTTPYSIQTASLVATTSINWGGYGSLWITPDGSRLYITGGTYGVDISIHEFGTPWDITTLTSLDSSLHTRPQELTTGNDNSVNAFWMNVDGTRMAFAHGDQSSQRASVFALGGNLSGDMIGTNAFNDVVFDGYKTIFKDAASTTDITVATGALAVAPTSTLSVAGNYTNNGEFKHDSLAGTLYLTGTSRTVSGETAGVSRFNNVVVTGSYTLPGGTTTVRNLTITSGDSLTLGGPLELTGDYINNGTFNADGNAVVANKLASDFAVAQYEGELDIDPDKIYNISPGGVAVSAAGDTLYVMDNDTDVVRAYSLATTSQILSGTYLHATSVSAYVGNVTSMRFRPDGTYMYLVDYDDEFLTSFALTTPWDITTAAFAGTTSISYAGAQQHSMAFSPDGTKLYLTNIHSAGMVRAYDLSVPWDSSTGVFAGALSTAWNGWPTAVAVSHDGRFFYQSLNTFTLRQYRLMTPWDITTAEIVGDISVPAGEYNDMREITFSNDGQYVYVARRDNESIEQYNLAQAQVLSGTMVGSSAFNTLTQDTLLPLTFASAASTTGTYTITPESVTADATTTVFNASSTYTFQNIDWQGVSSTTELTLRSSASGTPWYLDVPGTQVSVAYVNVQDSFAPEMAGGVIAASSTDAGNNCNWDFGAGLVGSCGAAPVTGEVLTIADHSSAQVNNAFNFSSQTDQPLFGFQLVPEAGVATTTDLTFTLSEVNTLASTSVSDLRIYQDVNSNGVYDNGTDVVVSSGGVIAITASSGIITFTEDFVVSAAADYLLVGSWTGLDSSAAMTVNLYPQDITTAAAGAGEITYTRSSRYSAEGVTTASFTVDIGEASDDRIVLVAIGGQLPNTASVTSSSLAGVSGTVLDYSAFTTIFDDSMSVTLVAAQVPTGSGSQTVSVTFSETNFNAVGQAWVIRGAEWPASQVAGNTDIASPASLSLTAPENGAAFGLVYSFGTTVKTISFGSIEATTTSQAAFYNAHIGNFADATNLPAGDATLTEDVSTDWPAANAVAFAAAAGASGVAGAVASVEHNLATSNSVTIGNHVAGVVSNVFTAPNSENAVVYSFNLLPKEGGAATTTDLVLTLTGLQRIETDTLSNWDLYIDENNDNELDGGDTLIDGAGIMTINGQNGAVTFSADIGIATTTNFIVVVDISDLRLTSAANIALLQSGVSTDALVIGAVSVVQHIRPRLGMVASGGSAPSGRSVVTGGETGGGGDIDEGPSDNITPDADFRRPTATGDPDNGWTNPTNALVSNNTYATAASVLSQSFSNFGISIPGGNSIQGIAVKVDASGTTAAGTIDVALSWNAGQSYTTAKATPTLVGNDVIYTVGGPSDLWGRSWTAAEFNDTNFRLRVTAAPSENTIRLDGVEVRVYRQVSGGGGGGGGAID